MFVDTDNEAGVETVYQYHDRTRKAKRLLSDRLRGAWERDGVRSELLKVRIERAVDDALAAVPGLLEQVESFVVGRRALLPGDWAENFELGFRHGLKGVYDESFAGCGYGEGYMAGARYRAERREDTQRQGFADGEVGRWFPPVNSVDEEVYRRSWNAGSRAARRSELVAAGDCE